MTNLSNLIEDIYKVLQGDIKVDESLYEELATNIVDVLRSRLSSPEQDRKELSLSSIGKPIRRVWYDLKYNGDLKEPIEPHQRLKFLYGDIIECILLWLAAVSGHSVKDRQKEVTHYGIKGHIDAIIDDEVVDVKSASPASYSKFKNGLLVKEDPFGYLAQITAYDEETGKGNPAFLVMNKVTGELCLYRPDKVFDCPDTQKLISDLKYYLDKDSPPDIICYKPIPDGASGNMKLDKGCYYCPYKKLCYPKLRAFKYSDGIRYLTKVDKTPKVEEIEI